MIDINAFHEYMDRCTPKGRVKDIQAAADAAGCGDMPELKQAAEMAANGVKSMRRFNFLLEKINAVIVEKAIIPFAIFGEKTKQERRQGGLSSHGLEPADRDKLQTAWQTEIDRLCLDRGMTSRAAYLHIAKNHGKLFPEIEKQKYHADTIRKKTQNPFTK